MTGTGNTPAYFPNLTGLRGLAAAWVLLFHTWEFSGAPGMRLSIGGLVIDFTPVAQCGYFGVDLFFVLSGFLLGIPFLRAFTTAGARPSWQKFWLNRCRRVLPAYWVQLLVLAGVCFYLGRKDLIDPLNLAGHVLLIQNFVPPGAHLLNPVYWSMPIEWDFYVILPLLVLLLTRSRWWLALIAVLIFVLTYRLVCLDAFFDPVLARWISVGRITQLPGRLDQFFFGALAAWFVVAKPQWVKFANCWLVIGLLALMALVITTAARGDFMAKLEAPYLLFHYSLVAVTFGCLILGAAGRSRLGSLLFGNRLLRFLGLISYSLYLWHYPMLQLAQETGRLDGAHGPAWLYVACICVPAIILAAWLSYRYIERPFLVTAPARHVLDKPASA
jgi:peptidoglycan/LPS O-acetylase OafA/YrhL